MAVAVEDKIAHFEPIFMCLKHGLPSGQVKA
jgi:hypothetical protein